MKTCRAYENTLCEMEGKVVKWSPRDQTLNLYESNSCNPISITQLSHLDDVNVKIIRPDPLLKRTLWLSGERMPSVCKRFKTNSCQINRRRASVLKVFYLDDENHFRCIGCCVPDNTMEDVTHEIHLNPVRPGVGCLEVVCEDGSLGIFFELFQNSKTDESQNYLKTKKLPGNHVDIVGWNTTGDKLLLFGAADKNAYLFSLDGEAEINLVEQSSKTDLLKQAKEFLRHEDLQAVEEATADCQCDCDCAIISLFSNPYEDRWSVNCLIGDVLQMEWVISTTDLKVIGAEITQDTIDEEDICQFDETQYSM